MADNDVEKLKVVDEKTYNLFQPGQKYLLTGQFDVRNARCGEWKVKRLTRRNNGSQSIRMISIKTFLSHGVRKRLSPSPM